MSTPLFFSTLSLAGGLVIFLMGLVILRESPRTPVNRATALMLFSGALGTLLGALGRLLNVTEGSGAVVAYAAFLRNFSYLWEFFFPSLLYFALVYPRRMVTERNLHVVEAALYVPYLCHLALVLFFSETTDLSKPFDPIMSRLGPGGGGDFLATVIEMLDVLITLVGRVHQQLFSIVNLTYAVLGIHLLARSRRQAASARVRGQLRIVLAGLTLCVGCYTAAKLLPVFFPYRPSGAFEAALISSALLVASSAIGFAIVRYKFLDMRNLARRSILYGATAVLFASVYIVVMKQIARLASTAFGPSVSVIEAGFIVVSVIIFQPLLIGLEELLETLVRRRDHSDPQLLMQELSRQLAAEVDLGSMRARIATGLQRGLLVDGARLLLVEERADGWRLDDGENAALLGHDAPVAALVRFFESSPEPALRDDFERSLPPLAEADRDRLLDWIQDYRLLVPITQQSGVRGILGVGPKTSGARFHAEDVGLLGLLGQQIAVSLENLRLLGENLAKRLLEEEIQLASEIQKELLPRSFPKRPGYATHGMSLSSKEVGGDYFDLFTLDGRYLHLAIADVSGKGVPAAMLMASLRAALRTNVQHLDSPAEVLSRINDLLYESTAPEKFATFFFGTLDTQSHELVYANAGHNYPILVGADGSARELDDGGLVLGILPHTRYEDGRLWLQPEETLFLYTDGVTEATRGGDEEFGCERLLALLARAAREEPDQLVGSVLAEVRAFTNGLDVADDVTMLVVQRREASPAPPVAT